MANINIRHEEPYQSDGALVMVRVGGELQPVFSFAAFEDGEKAAEEHAALLNKQAARKARESERPGRRWH